MDYEHLAETIRADFPGVREMELVIYEKRAAGTVRNTIAIRYYDDGDYQWASSVKPLYDSNSV